MPKASSMPRGCHRIREAVGKVGSTVDTDAIMGRFEVMAGQAGGQDRRRQAQAVGRRCRSGQAEGRTGGSAASAGAASHRYHGEKLADRAPGAFDKLAARRRRSWERSPATKDRSRRADRAFKGQIKEDSSPVSEMADSRSKDAAEAIKTKVDETRRNEPKSRISSPAGGRRRGATSVSTAPTGNACQNAANPPCSV